MWTAYVSASRSTPASVCMLHDSRAQLQVDGTQARASMVVTTESAYRTHPGGWEDLVVWENHRNLDRGGIYGYFLGTQLEHALLVHPAHPECPTPTVIIVWNLPPLAYRILK